MSVFRFAVPTATGPLQVEILERRALFILGRNGTGKSALVHHIRGQCHSSTIGSVIYLPGSRPSYFAGDSLSMNANTRSQYDSNHLIWDSSPDVRTRPNDGPSRNERAIYDLRAAELQYCVQAANEIAIDGINSPAIARLQSKLSPLNRVNRLLQQANLPISVIVDSGELIASREGSPYSISKMSDGERTALVFIADVISAKPGSLFLIDEPELHLHRAIIVPLLSALLAERPDCTMIISTHELALASDNPENPVILVRGCNWNGAVPSSWNLDLLPDSFNIPDDLRVDLFGSRQTILFIEGTESSRDKPLYAILFPKASLRHRSSCTDVRRAVVGLRQVEAFHHARTFGLVDNDGMDEAFQNKLLGEGVYALTLFSVESLYYAPETIAAVAARQGETFNVDPLILVAAAREKALSTLRQQGKVEHLAARVAERHLRDKLLSQLPSRAEMVAKGGSAIEVSYPSPYAATLTFIQRLLDIGDLDGIIVRFPIRESGILGDIAQSLRFSGQADFEQAALVMIGNDTELATKIRDKLGYLSELLQA